MARVPFTVNTSSAEDVSPRGPCMVNDFEHRTRMARVPCTRDVQYPDFLRDELDAAVK
jgi:hypothetical protein